MSLKEIIVIALSLPKTIYFNIRYLSFKDAIHLPIFLRYDTSYEIKGNIVIDAPLKIALIRFGFWMPYACNKNESTSLIIQQGGQLLIKGDAHLGHGARIIVRENAKMEIGSNFSISCNTCIQAYKDVCIGNDVQISWGCMLMDSDTHTIYNANNEIINEPRPIIISDNVWIGCNVLILKGSIIPKSCVVGGGSVVSGDQFDEKTIIVGNPATSKRAIGGWAK